MVSEALIRALANERLSLIEELAAALSAETEKSKAKELVIAELEKAALERLDLLRDAEVTSANMRKQLEAKDNAIKELAAALAEMRLVASQRLELIDASDKLLQELQQQLLEKDAAIQDLHAAAQMKRRS